MKKIVFLIIATLLVIGLVLPGCGGGGGAADWPTRELRTPGKLTIGVCGDMGYDQGLHAVYGAQLAATDIGTFSVGGTSLTVAIRSIDTDEVLNPGGAAGTAAVSAEIDDCDFMVGGFRTEGVIVYREPIMTANMTFMNCGAATEILQNAVLTNYDRYKYFFKATPMNEFQLSEAQSKLLTMLVGMTGNTSYTTPKIALLAEDAEWTRVSRENAQAKFIALGYDCAPTPWLVSPTATNIGTTLNSIKAADPDVVYCVMSGPVGVTYGNTVGDYLDAGVLHMGINVEAQREEFPSVAKYAEGMVFLDGWCPGVNLTDQTYDFITDFDAAHGVPPIYTAATHDAVYTLVEALQDKGTVVGGAVQFAPPDIVEYIEGNVRTGTASTAGVYPMWDGSTKGTYVTYAKNYTDVPALNSGQVLTLYPWLANAVYATGNWSWNADDWTMPPFTPHDLVFGMKSAAGAIGFTPWATSIGSQWQDVGGGTLGKVAVFPKPWAAVLGLPTSMTAWMAGMPWTPLVLGTAQAVGAWDQYGYWNVQYPGTGLADITAWVTYLKAKYSWP